MFHEGRLSKRVMRLMTVGALLVSVVRTGTMEAAAQEPEKNPNEGNLIFWRYPDNYLENQARVAFGTIDEALQANPPQKEMSLLRKMALISLDQLLHDTHNDKQEPFYTFINTRMQRMLDDMERPVKKGLRIYKLYNDGFIIKTKDATVAVDLVPGGPNSRPFISDSIIYKIAGKCDAMFVSHAHGDHANLSIAKAFASRGKLVIAPKGLWTGVNPMIQQLLVADTTVDVPFNELNMTLHILPGHQDDMYNNIYVMEFKNAGTVAHTGDQWNEEDVVWIDKVHEHYKIDVLLPNCWINQMERSLKGFGPKIIITGHENEMEHTIDHREAYWITMKKFERMSGLNIPNVLMTWGESYDYKR
ncbi:MAG: MBL fold metallo-hydrolase [Paludibacteraceae bacterium]|nr:MBL fold metallo-hydrolase [Paludibacteraceae bacterium]